MKIEIFEKALDVLLNKFNLKKPVEENEIVSSYYVHIEEAFTDTTYYYVRNKQGQEALYLYPGYFLLIGENFLTKKELENLPKKTYKSKQHLTRNEPTENFFFKLMNTFKEETTFMTSKRYSDAFSYLMSLYYNEDKKYLDQYNELYNAVKKECDNLGVLYETEPEKIIEQKIIESETDETSSIDISICKSIETIEKYYQSHILSCTNSRQLSYEITELQYIKQSFTFTYNGNFLTNSNNLLFALENKKYPNRESILKNYMEFFITKDISFEIIKYLDKLIEQAENIKYQLEQKQYNQNTKFIEDLEEMLKHNLEEEEYRFHATVSEEDAKKILEEGFYSYAKDLESTSIPEMTSKEVLSYSYGDGIIQNGDYIIVLAVPEGEDIVEELTLSEQELISIVPRRNAMIGCKPTYKVDKKYIVGFIDKKHEKIILNSEYINNSKKQINI